MDSAEFEKNEPAQKIDINELRSCSRDIRAALK
jgi:hypothetical protein